MSILFSIKTFWIAPIMPLPKGWMPPSMCKFVFHETKQQLMSRRFQVTSKSNLWNLLSHSVFCRWVQNISNHKEIELVEFTFPFCFLWVGLLVMGSICTGPTYISHMYKQWLQLRDTNGHPKFYCNSLVNSKPCSKLHFSVFNTITRNLLQLSCKSMNQLMLEQYHQLQTALIVCVLYPNSRCGHESSTISGKMGFKARNRTQQFLLLQHMLAHMVLIN
jgi:hypothetical protein